MFFAKIVCSDGIKKIEVDARPSDAIAIGLRFGVDIYTYEAILAEAGIVLTDEAEEEEIKPKKKSSSKKSEKSFPEVLKDLSSERLQQMLDESLAKEDYEKAAKIRDEMNNRN